MRFHDKNSSGELFNYLFGTPMANLKNFLNQFSMQVPTQMISMVISVAAMLTYDWLLTAVMIAALLIAMLLNYQSRKKIRRLSGDLIKCESEASKFTDDILHGSSAVKMYAIEDEINTEFKEKLNDLKSKGITLSFTQWLEGTRYYACIPCRCVLLYLQRAYHR